MFVGAYYVSLTSHLLLVVMYFWFLLFGLSGIVILSCLHSPEKRNGSSGLTARRSASVERCKMAVTRD